jgi:acetyl esterase/lipase
VSAPLDDATEAMRMIRQSALAPKGVGVVGLSSGGHLAACLFAQYPPEWPAPSHAARPDVAVIGYAPISTNAAGRTIVANKPPLPPVEKQAMYDRLQPDAQILPSPPPAFIVYAANDPVVPVDNALRLNKAWVGAGGHSNCIFLPMRPMASRWTPMDCPCPIGPTCARWLGQVGFLG